ncbi:MAG: phage tail protein [Anaerolineae bacterium]
MDESRLATVDHVADFCHRYPGEVVTFFTRVSVRRSLSALTLRVSLPKELVLEEYQPPAELEGLTPSIEVGDHVNYLVWSFEGQVPAGARYEYQARARIAPTERDMDLESRARATSSGHGILAEETVTVAVWAKGRYLRYLPELYANDELMGRFLMLFESFWSPIETQIGSTHCYFDPEMTPVDFLPWLASWMGMEPDEHLSKERQRLLIRSAVSLHRMRGTRQGLQEYLGIYTGGEAQIIEHRAHNFFLGADARLGPGIALGRNNLPHTFSVILHLPPLALSAENTADDSRSLEERARQERERRRTIQAIIEAEKPAYTAYTLHIETMT